MMLPNFAVEDEVTAWKFIFIKVILLKCHFSFPLNWLAFMVGKERSRRDSWWWWKAVLMVWGMSEKCSQSSVAWVRVGARGLILNCRWENVRLFCVFKLALQFSPGEIICRGEKKTYIFLWRKTKQTLGVLGDPGERWVITLEHQNFKWSLSVQTWFIKNRDLGKV